MVGLHGHRQRLVGGKGDAANSGVLWKRVGDVRVGPVHTAHGIRAGLRSPGPSHESCCRGRILIWIMLVSVVFVCVCVCVFCHSRRWPSPARAHVPLRLRHRRMHHPIGISSRLACVLLLFLCRSHSSIRTPNSALPTLSAVSSSVCYALFRASPGVSLVRLDVDFLSAVF